VRLNSYIKHGFIFFYSFIELIDCTATIFQLDCGSDSGIVLSQLQTKVSFVNGKLYVNKKTRAVRLTWSFYDKSLFAYPMKTDMLPFTPRGYSTLLCHYVFLNVSFVGCNG